MFLFFSLQIVIETIDLFSFEIQYILIDIVHLSF